MTMDSNIEKAVGQIMYEFGTYNYNDLNNIDRGMLRDRITDYVTSALSKKEERIKELEAVIQGFAFSSISIDKHLELCQQLNERIKDQSENKKLREELNEIEVSKQKAGVLQSRTP